jgi:hypothetical protein
MDIAVACRNGIAGEPVSDTVDRLGERLARREARPLAGVKRRGQASSAPIRALVTSAVEAVPPRSRVRMPAAVVASIAV